MNIKKARTSLTSELERSPCTAILFRLFTLWAFSCGFTLAAGQSDVSLSSTVNISTFAASASEIASVISTSSSQSVQASFDVNRTNSSSLNSLHNKTGVLTALQSSNFPVVGSTEPITLALSFIATSTTTAPSVPKSVTSLLDASSFSIAGFTEPLSLALFTSESLSNQSVAASLSPSNSLLASFSSVLSSSHATNASSTLHTAAMVSKNTTTSKSSSGETTFSKSKKLPSSYASKLRISSTHDQSTTSAGSLHSSQQHLSSEVSDKLSTSRQVTTETHSHFQSSIINGTRSSVHTFSHTSSTVSKHTASLPPSSESVSYQAYSEVIRTSPTFLETNLAKSDAATSLVPSLSPGAILANSSTFKASNTIILPDPTTVPGQSLSLSAESLSSINGVSSTRTLEQIPSTMLSQQTQTLRNASVVTLISSGPSSSSSMSSQSTTESSSVRFSWTSSDSLNLETDIVQTTLNNSSTPSSYSGDRVSSTSSSPNISTALLPKISDPQTGAVVNSLSASEVYTAATGSKTFIPTSSTPGSFAASLAFYSHNSSSVVIPATLTETTVTSSVVFMASTSSSPLAPNSSELSSFISNATVLSSSSFAHLKPSSTEFSSSYISAVETRNLSTCLPSSTSGFLSVQTPLVSVATVPLNATTLHVIASTRNVIKISHYLSQSEFTIYINSTVQALATASSESSNSSLIDNVTTSFDASRLSTSTLRVVVSGGRFSSYVSTDLISSAGNVTSGQSVPRLSTYFSTSLLHQSQITHSFTISTSSGISLERFSTDQSGLHHSTEISVSSLKSGAVTPASTLHSRIVGTREGPSTVLLSSHALSENSSHVASDTTYGLNETSVFSTLLSQIQSISFSPSYSKTKFRVSSMSPSLTASIVRISSLGKVQSSTVQPSATSSFGSLKFSTNSSSLLITSAVFSLSPLPSTYMSRSSLVVETESSFPRLSISSESAQLHAHSSRKSLELPSSISASQSESVNKPAIASDHQHSSSYNVLVSATSNSLLKSPGFTSTVISENVSVTTSFQIDPSSSDSVPHSSPVMMSSSLHIDPSSSDSVTHSSPVMMSSSLHVDPSSSDPVTHSSPVMMSSSLHVDPSSSDLVPHSSPVMMSSSLHVDPSSSDPVPHSSPVMMSSSLHVDPSSSDPVTHSSPVMMSSSLHVDPSSSDSVTHSSLALLSTLITSTVPSFNVATTSQQPSFTSEVRQSSSEQSFVSSLTQTVANESVVDKLSSVTITATTSFARSISSSNPYTLTGVAVVTSSYMVASSSLRPSSADMVVTSSAVVIPPGFFVRFGINVPLNESVSDASFKQQLREGILAVYQNGSTDGMLGNTSVKNINILRSPDSNSTNVTVTFQVLNVSEPLLGYSVIQGIDQASYTLAQAVGYQVIQVPLIVHLSSTSYTTLTTSAMPVLSFQITNVSRTSFTSGVSQSGIDASFVSSLTQSVASESVVHTSSSVKTSLSQSVLTGVAVVTSSYMVSSSSLRPSSADVVVTSSAVVIPPGFFVRFGINVSLNKSVTDASFKQQLRVGILAVYQNGSTDGMLGNTSVKIINIARSLGSNNTNVTVTFQVLNGSEPLLGYSVIQGINQASYTLPQAVGYQVIEDPIIVHLSSTSSTMLMTSAMSVSSFQTTNVSRTSFTTEVRQSSSEASFVSSLTQSVASESVHESSSGSITGTTSLPQSISSRLLSINTASSDTSSYFVSTSETKSLLSSGSPSGRVSPTLASSTSFQTSRTVSLSSVKVIHSTTTQPSTPETISMTSSRTVVLVSLSSRLLPQSSGSTLLSLNSSIPLTQPSRLLSTSYTISGQSASSVTTFPSLNLSSIVTKVTETPSTILKTSSVALKLTSFTSSLGTTVPDSVTQSSPAMLSASSPYFKLTVVSSTPLISSLFSSVTRKHPNITTAAVQVSSIPAINASSSSDVSFPPGYTAVVTSTVRPMTTRAANPSGISALTAPATLMSIPSPSAQPNSSSAAVSLMSSFTSVKPVSSRASVLSSLQTFSSTYPLPSASPASLSSGSLSTPVQSLLTAQLKTSDILSQPLKSSAFSRQTSFLPFNINKSTTQISLETTSRSSVSLAHSVPSVSASSKLTTRVSPSAFKASIPTTLAVIPSSRISITTTASDKRSRDASTHSLISSSQRLSQTTDTFFSVRTSEMSSRFLIAATSVKSHIVEASSSRPLTTALPSKSVIHLRSSAIIASSEVTSSSAKAIKTIVSSTRTKELSSPSNTVPVGSITLTSNSLASVETGITSVVLTKSFPPTSTQLLSSSLVHARSSFPILSSLATPAVTSGMLPGSTHVTEKSLKLSSVYVSETSTTKSFASTMSLSTVSLYLTSAHDAATKLTPGSVSTVSETSSSAATSVEPTEPIRPTTNPNNTEGLVGIQLLVPTTHNETTSSFREEIELRLAAAYRWGDEKARTRAKRDLAAPLTLNGKNLNLWKRSAAFKVYEKRARRYRRQVDNIVALAETIRRAKPIVGEEIVDIEYRIFDGIAMLSAEHIVETMNRLSEAELVSVMKYGVTLRPYVVKDIKVEPTPRARTKWETLIPAIIVPIVVIVFLCLSFAFARFAARRKRKQQNVELDKEHPYENLEVRVRSSHDDIPPKSNHGIPKKKRSRSISSTSSHELPPKCPTLPIPDYSPGPSDTPGKPRQQYRRRTGGRGGDHRTKKVNHPAMGGNTANGHIQGERPLKKSRDVKDNIEMEHLAGVVENRPQMRDEKLASSLKRPDPPVKFMALPPLVQTPLVGLKPSIPHAGAEEKKEHDRIIVESGVPQANVERWRNKMRHREKLRQDMRERERKKEKKLKKREKEENRDKEKDVAEDQPSTLSRSLTAERKRRSRLDRWRNNRLGTSRSSSTSSSSSSSSVGDSDAENKHEKDKEKKKKDKNKKAKIPPLATGGAAKATAQDALRETAWTIKETPGVRLVSVRPISEAQQDQQVRSPQPVYLQNGVQGHKPPPTRQKDRVHYLLETGYPALPVFPAPPETRDLNDDLAYEDMEGLDPYTVQYDEDVYYPRDAFIRSSVPAEPRQAFSNPSFHEDEHIYEEPMVTPASLPQTQFVSPQDSQARVLIPTPYARSYLGRVPVTKGRPTSASEHAGSARQTRARPTSARTEPMARYAPPPGRRSPPNRSLASSVPGSRYMLANRPTVATALQPSIGTSPRYMVDPERQKEEPPSSFDGARAILSRAQANVDRFEKDNKSHAPGETDGAPAPERLYAKPPRKTPPHAALKEPFLTGSSRLDVAAREHAELEAQLLVSQALARARNNVRV